LTTADARIRVEKAREADSDADLARRAREGDRPAFARIYERYAATIHGVLLAVAPRQEARDLVQEVFLLALRAIPRLDDPASVGPWLIKIARNRAHDAHKSKRTVVELTEDHGAPPAEPEGSHGARVEDDEEAERALEAVRSLPQAYRETLILRLVEGLSGPEIAARTGMTHGSVRVNLHRGMKLLRERLSQAGGR
jgi:RNA polymerase sigma-70 factor (ECF subfamily)